MAQNSSAPRSQEDYITQISEVIEGKVTKRLSKEFNGTENRILGALARLDDFLMNRVLPGRSGTTPEPSQNALKTSQGTNEDNSQNDPHPEAGLFHGQMTQNSDPGECSYMVTGVQRERERERERVCSHDMVTGATKQLGNCHNMTGVHILPPSTSSRKQKKNRSTSQKHLRQSKQTNFCWPFSSWQIITNLRTFTITSTEFSNCQSH